PRNPENPFYRMPASINPAGSKFIDLGLGAILKDPQQNGKFKVPTLRNVDQRPSVDFVKAYGHNGFFKSLKEVVHFYNARDTDPDADPDAVLPAVATDANGHFEGARDMSRVIRFLQHDQRTSQKPRPSQRRN